MRNRGVFLVAVCASVALSVTAAIAGPTQTVSRTINGQTTDYPYIHTEAFSAVHGPTTPALTLPPVVGKAVSYSDSQLTLQLENKSTKTYAVSPQWFDRVKPAPGQWYAVSLDTDHHVVRVALADQSESATVKSVTKDGVTLELQDGRTIAVRKASFTSTPANLVAGMRVMLVTHDGGYSSALKAAQ
jgi:hypothetical protein